MSTGTGYTPARRYARAKGNPKKSKSDAGKKHRHHKKKSSSKEKVADKLSPSLLKTLDNRYVEEDEAETKLSPMLNTTNWNELNTFGTGTGLGPTITNPVVNNAPIAPCTLCDPTGQSAWAVTGNIFQFGKNLSSDLQTYNTNFTASNQEPSFPIHGMDWFNPVQTGLTIPIGTNPTRVMEGQYLNFRRSTLNFSINMSTVNPTEARSFNYPVQFRVMHVVAKRENSPVGAVYSPVNQLWLKENGQAAGLGQLFDQTAATVDKVSKQQAMKYPINKQYFTVLSDFGFQLQNPVISPADMSSQPTNSAPHTNMNGSYTFPVQKQFTITRDWGRNNKTIMLPDVNNVGEYIPQDLNYKDYIIILAVRGLCTPSSAGGLINVPDYGKGSGYTVSFFGTTSAKDL